MPGDNSCTVQCELLLPEPARYRTCFRKMEIFRQAMPGDNSCTLQCELLLTEPARPARPVANACIVHSVSLLPEPARFVTVSYSGHELTALSQQGKNRNSCPAAQNDTMQYSF